MSNNVTMGSSCKLLRSTGLRSTQVYPILNKIERWVKSNGEEWTVNRLKLLKLGYVNKLLYESYLLPSDSWISHDSFGPKGPFRSLTKLKKPHKALSAFMVYTSFISKKVTEKQLEKFTSSLGRGQEVPLMVLQAVSSSPYIHFVKNQNRFKNLFWQVDRNIRVPQYIEDPNTFYSNPILKNKKISHDAIKESFGHPWLTDWVNDNVDRVPDSYYKASAYSALEGINIPDDYVGRIGFIQEPGYKLRVIANPLPGFQSALSAFGNQLYDSLKLIKEDCTFDQDSGIKDVQNFLKSGGTLCGIDLSNATDRFPLQFTESLLRGKVNDSDLDLWLRVCRGKWDSPYGDIQWKHGQPLGVYPSFAAFALSHHALIKPLKPKFYRVLGDDVVIDTDTAQQLRHMYSLLGLKISEDKSTDSSVGVEFAGRLIFRDKILAQPKVRDISDRSFMDLSRQIGPNVLGLLKPRQRTIVKLFAEVPCDVHPLGLNWNPKGKTYNQRLEESAWISLLFKPALEQLRSATSKSLSDLKDEVLLRNGVNPSFLLESDHKLQTQIESLEGRVLDRAGVTRIDSDHMLTNWSPYQNLPSDPRGRSLLSILEERCAPVLHDQPTRISNLSRRRH